MRRKWLCLLISCIVGTVLVLTSCGTAEKEEEEEEIAEEEEEEGEEEEEEVAEEEMLSNEPQYGGVLTVAQRSGITVFDPAQGQSGGEGGSSTLALTNEYLLGMDWTKGPAGTGDVTLQYGWEGLEYMRGQLVESWETPELGVFVLHIRPGVHWANSGSDAAKLVNGREFTVEDIVYNFNYYKNSPLSSPRRNEPAMAAAAQIEQIDSSTVKMTFPENPFGGFTNWIAATAPNYAPEVIEEYGNMMDWRNSVGTGPFMLMDYVEASSATLVRNPNYWDTDPIGPGKGNQLPYVDEVKILIIPDVSTQMSAIRTAKIDWAPSVSWADAASIRKTTPDIQSARMLMPPNIIAMRQDKQDLPFSNKSVRQALLIAVNYQSLVDELYGGEAEIMSWPLRPLNAFKEMYQPLDQLPAVVQELYSYSPDKAKQLLANAGYASGFDVQVICQSLTNNVDLLSVIKDMWEEIGVNMEIQSKEVGAFNSIRARRAYDSMILEPAPQALGPYFHYLDMQSGARMFNASYINDPVIDAAYNDSQKNVFINMPRVYQNYREIIPYVLEQAYNVPMPAVYNYLLWWPWVKNYHGEYVLHGTSINATWMTFAWLDQNLRKQMIGK